MRSESVDPSSEALLLLPDISARMCVCQHTICIYRVDVVCVCVLPAESDLEFFWNRFLECRMRCRHIHIENIYFHLSLTYTKHKTQLYLLALFLSLLSFSPSFSSCFTLLFSVYFVSSIFPLFAELNIYYRIQTIFLLHVFVFKEFQTFFLVVAIFSFVLSFRRIVLDLVFVDFCRHFFSFCFYRLMVYIVYIICGVLCT